MEIGCQGVHKRKKSLGTTGTNGAGSKIIFCGVQLNTHISY